MATITIKRSIKRPIPPAQRRIGSTSVLNRAPRKLEQWEFDVWNAIVRDLKEISRNRRR